MSILVNVIISIIVLVVAYIIASLYYPMLAGGAGYGPTPRKTVAEALIEASKLCDHVKGVEIEPIRWFIAKLRARKAKVILGNLFKRDISDADVIFIFQYEGRINNRIVMKIKAETRSETRIISYLHPIENVKPVKSQNEIFIYKT
jgi:hypothetical protein